MAQISRQKGLRQLIGMLSIAYQNSREPSQRARPATELMRGTLGLMLGYCDAIEECGRLPAFSIWPLVRLAFKAWLFAFALYVAMILLIPDFILLLLRTTIGWPRLVLGRRVIVIWRGRFGAYGLGKFHGFVYSVCVT